MPTTSKATDWLARALGGLSGPIRAVKLGPSVVAVLATTSVFGLIAVCFTTYFLSGTPLVALGAGGLIMAFTLLVIFLLLRFTERNPLIAALGGGQIYRLIDSQMGAKNPKIIDAEASPVFGASGNKEGER